MVAATVKNASQRKTSIVVMPFIDRVMQELQVQGLELQQPPDPIQHHHVEVKEVQVHGLEQQQQQPQ